METAGLSLKGAVRIVSESYISSEEPEWPQNGWPSSEDELAQRESSAHPNNDSPSL
jgi:hypothetical protein